MELRDFFKALGRHRLLLVLVPVVTLLIAGVLVSRMPDAYPSHARLATGVTDRSQQVLSGNAYDGEAKVNQEFNNLIQMLLLKKLVDQVSYKLMLHDLQSTAPFRKPSGLMRDLSMSAASDSALVRSFSRFSCFR